MKTEIIRKISVKLEENDIKSIEKVNALINDLVNKGIEYEYDCYEINNSYYDMEQLDNFINFLNDLVYTEAIKLT